ncbi:MAG: hypothetical protein EA369_01650 [Bradymonadales bacterium]|nr:MAG: hypothetical protein EA369_01650 [Bradymonadales bacterium]
MGAYLMKWSKVALLLAFCASLFGLPIPTPSAEICRSLISRVLEIQNNPTQFYPDADPVELQRRLERILARLRVRPEQRWREGREFYETDADVRAALENGELIETTERPGVGISGNMTYKVSTPILDRVMDKIAEDFIQALETEGLDTQNTKIVVSSIVRPHDYQQLLAGEGRPSASRSSHSYGIAFDISYQWFEEHSPQKAEVLRTVLERFQAEGKINLVQEEFEQVWHIAVSPEFYREIESERERAR